MLVLREARQIAAAKLGRELPAVVPTTVLGDDGAEVLADLLTKLVGRLRQEHFVEPPAIMVEPNPGPVCAAVGLAGACQSATVAGVAATATRVAVRMLVSHRLDIGGRELKPELDFAVDLGADSLTRVDLVLLLEEALDVAIPDDSMSLVQTLGDAESYAALYDRAREGSILAIGPAARGLLCDTELSQVGDARGQVVLSQASAAIGMTLPDHDCATLQAAVRLAFLTHKLRIAFAATCGIEEGNIVGETRPVVDLGLSEEDAHRVFARVAAAMDLDLSIRAGDEQLGTVAGAALALCG